MGPCWSLPAERKGQTEGGLVHQGPCSLPGNALQLHCSQVPAVSLDGSPAGMLPSSFTLCRCREQGPEFKSRCSKSAWLLPWLGFQTPWHLLKTFSNVPSPLCIADSHHLCSVNNQEVTNSIQLKHCSTDIRALFLFLCKPSRM